MSINSLSTSTLDDAVLAGIRQEVANFLHRCGLKYKDFVLDEALYAECLQEATNRGFPMDGEYSIRAHMANGVSMFCAGYAHLPDRATRMWICLFTGVSTRIDDILDNGLNSVHLHSFNENFVNCRPQGNPLLNAFDELMREAHHHYSPLVANMIITSSLDFISGIMLEHGTNNMQVSTDAPSYPDYCRVLGGVASAYSLFIFPSTIPYRQFIQSMPDVMFIVNTVNDILSYYKEEMEGETTNYVSLVAASGKLTKRDALHGIIEKTMQAHHNIIGCLKPCPEAYDAYLSFFYGYINYHAALKRYKLEEIMLEASSA
ncbi:isoprenoid synthase domain-containing protein [Suillus placidus]|uniref:Isoprenoid synthase domain-containing protein n=1 Tax=Suillus placidus TaxID=48579 RepID=A0A9P7A099_9AGAM|nr:isoprenoid synthase domain-containing protein [Suillus placidus]